MSRRLWFPTTTASDVNPAFHASWTATGQAVRRKLAKDKGTSAITIGSTIDVSTSPAKALDRQYVSDPMNAGHTFTAGDLISMQVMVREFATTDNVDQAILAVQIFDRAGTTLRSTLCSGVAGPNGEFINNATCRNKTVNPTQLAGSTYVTQQGDRIVVELGYTSIPGGTTPQAAAKWGENAADLPINETQTTDGAGWIEFIPTLTFEGDPVVTEIQGAVSGSGSSSASLSSKTNIQGTASGSGQTSATAAIIVGLQGAVTSLGTPVGSLSNIIALVGQTNGAGNTAAALVNVRPVAGSVNGIGLTAAGLVRILSLIGNVMGVGVTLAAFEEEGGFITGAVIGIGTPAGVLGLIRQVSGQVQGSSQAQGRVDQAIGLEGEAEGAGISQASLNVVIGLIGQALAVGQASGNLTNILGIVIEIPPCPTTVLLEPSATGVLLEPSSLGCIVESSICAADLICLTEAEEQELANG